MYAFLQINFVFDVARPVEMPLTFAACGVDLVAALCLLSCRLHRVVFLVCQIHNYFISFTLFPVFQQFYCTLRRVPYNFLRCCQMPRHPNWVGADFSRLVYTQPSAQVKSFRGMPQWRVYKQQEPIVFRLVYNQASVADFSRLVYSQLSVS